MKLPTTSFRRYLIAACAAALLSYTLGVTGVNPVEAVTDSRCSDGALIAHVPVPKDLGRDALPAGQSEQTNLSSVPSSKQVLVSGANLLPDPGLETTSGSGFGGWTPVTTGHITDSFPQVLGYNSGHAARVNVSSFSSGAAYWSPGYVGVTGGAYYEFSDYYRSNVQTWAQATFKYPSGLTQTVTLATTQKSTTWAPFTTRFYVPVGVTGVLLSHNLGRIGALETDDYSLKLAAAPSFTQGLISIAFVGAVESDFQLALPQIEQYGLPATFYVYSGYLDQPGYLSQAQLYQVQSAGDEIASHSQEQANLSGVTAKKLAAEVSGSKSGLTSCYGQITDFASPEGVVGAQAQAAVSHTYLTNLSYDEGFNSPGQYRPYALKVQFVTTDTPEAQLSSWIATAKQDHLWLILAYRGVDNDPNGTSRPPLQFESDMQQVFASGLAVKTVRDGASWASYASHRTND